MEIKILDNCVGCGTCVFSCQKRAIRTYGRAYIDKEKCVLCKICIKYCPIKAIKLEN
ncbi:4Fe-4S binding protein [Methanocaldococcus indicus]|uniref:4Fe-4S binding protein n=1 Tax=Methanocaldococcus indicus TaxID=213231 RepID=UPI003C6CEEC9